jgi:hypothetical protein
MVCVTGAVVYLGCMLSTWSAIFMSSAPVAILTRVTPLALEDQTP